MTIKIIGRAKDYRTDTHVIYAQMPISDYLALVGDDFDQFQIQRKREKHKAYQRMKKDIVEGALLPTITLSVDSEYIDEILPFVESGDAARLGEALEQPGKIDILDGLQRTFILSDLQAEGVNFRDDQCLLLEFWLERNLKHLIYRLIVLNAGQKPMSMRHQVELLFATLKHRLQQDIPALTIYTERDGNRRTRPGKFALDRLVSGYVCFLTKSPEVKKESIVAQRIIDDNILDSDEDELNQTFESYENYLRTYVDLDVATFNAYSESGNNGSWLAEENVINACFAAISNFGISPSRVNRINLALNSLRLGLENGTLGPDPLGIETFYAIQNDLNPRKDNVGHATRKLLMSGFKEYFREEGEKPLHDCWVSEAT